MEEVGDIGQSSIPAAWESDTYDRVAQTVLKEKMKNLKRLRNVFILVLVLANVGNLYHMYVQTSSKNYPERVFGDKTGLSGSNNADKHQIRGYIGYNDSLVKHRANKRTDQEINVQKGETRNLEIIPEIPEMDYHGRDLMKDPPMVFDNHFKNPCFWEKLKLHCLPYVILIGVKKSGTTDLFFRLSLHPDFVKSGFKEAQFFARKRFSAKFEDNISTYVDMFDGAAGDILHAAETGTDGQQYNNRTITGEGSPSNLHLNSHWRHLPGNEGLEEPRFLIADYIHHFLPDVKILIIFRNPIERLYSDYYHEYGRLKRIDDPNPYHFHSVVDNGLKMYRDCFKIRSVRSCVYDNTFYDITKIQIQLGIYYIYWLDLIRVFRRDQILVLQNKNLRDKKATMTKVYNFLSLRSLNVEEMQTVIDAKDGYPRKAEYVAKGPMLDETFRLLHDFYAPFNKKMTDITGDVDFVYGSSGDHPN